MFCLASLYNIIPIAKITKLVPMLPELLAVSNFRFNIENNEIVETIANNTNESTSFFKNKTFLGIAAIGGIAVVAGISYYLHNKFNKQPAL